MKKIDFQTQFCDIKRRSNRSKTVLERNKDL